MNYQVAPLNLFNVAGIAFIAAGCITACSDSGVDSPNAAGGTTNQAGSGTGGAAGAAAGNSALGGAGMTGMAGTATAGGGGGSLPNGGGGQGGGLGGSGGTSAGSGSGGRGGVGGAAGSAGTAGSGGSGGSGGGMRSAGCGQPAKLMSGTRSLQSGGKNRSFMIRIPENYDSNHPYWLVFGFHWNGGTANDVDSGGTSGYTWSYYGLREQADDSTNARAIFVAPQGLGNGWGNSGNEDVTFTDDMLKQVKDGLCVDTKHVFSIGFSYGGGMTKALGCQRPNDFRAIAVLAGADFLSGGCDGTTTAPVAFFGAHSINDGTNSYSSGIAILNRFVKNNGCTAQTPPQPGAGNTHTCTKFSGCKDGYPVQWCSFDGGGHTPAPVDGSGNGSGGGDRTWTKTEVWKFFNQFQ